MKKLMKKYGHVWILSYGLIYLPWFAALQQNVGKPYHVMHTALDDLIPFNEYFIVPYLLWFLYVAAAIAYFFFTSKDDYYRLCTFLVMNHQFNWWFDYAPIRGLCLQRLKGGCLKHLYRLASKRGYLLVSSLFDSSFCC